MRSTLLLPLFAVLIIFSSSVLAQFANTSSSSEEYVVVSVEITEGSGDVIDIKSVDDVLPGPNDNRKKRQLPAAYDIRKKRGLPSAYDIRK